MESCGENPFDPNASRILSGVAPMSKFSAIQRRHSSSNAGPTAGAANAIEEPLASPCGFACRTEVEGLGMRVLPGRERAGGSGVPRPTVNRTPPHGAHRRGDDCQDLVAETYRTCGGLTLIMWRVAA